MIVNNSKKCNRVQDLAPIEIYLKQQKGCINKYKCARKFNTRPDIYITGTFIVMIENGT